LDEYALELEYRFINGDSLYETLLEGRDTVSYEPALFRVVINNPDETVTYIGRQEQLNYTKITRRKLEPEKAKTWD
jgi:hypothetical protein